MEINLICFAYVYLLKKFNDLYIKSAYKFRILDQFERLLIYRWIRRRCSSILITKKLVCFKIKTWTDYRSKNDDNFILKYK